MKKLTVPAMFLALSVAGCGDLSETPTEPGSMGEPAGGAVLSEMEMVPELAESGLPYVLVLDEEEPPSDVEGLVAAAGGKLLFHFPEVGLAVAEAGAAEFPALAAQSNGVMEVGSTGLWTLPTDELTAIQADAPTLGDDFYANRQWSIRRVGADQAWAAGFTGSHETVVAILDTGIDDSHPDLAPNVVHQTCMQLSGPCGADHLTNEHGTMVAGVVAAAFGSGRAVGVGPNLGLASYQVFEDAGGAHDAVLWWAILDAADPDQGFQVINMSLGGYGNFAEYHELSAAAWTAWNRVIGYAIRQGVTVVASAGNGAISTNGAVFHIPGDIPGTINVAGTAIRPDPVFPQPDGYDIQAFYSNSGASVNLVAPSGDWGPGGDPLQVLPSGYLGMQYGVATTYWNDQYAFAAGNSFATSHVAGAAGLILDENPGLSPRQVAAILTRTAAKMGNRQIFGHGMLDVPRALEAASK